MAGNTFGTAFRLTTFGESHGKAIGGIIDGCPANINIDESEIQSALDRRRPGAGGASTTRLEPDKVKLLSGILNGVTTGTPIGFIIANRNHRSGDYDRLANLFRPGHADLTYFCKYNGIRDHRGGGRASGRETACRVVGGAIAQALLCRATQGLYHVDSACISLGGTAVPEAEIDLGKALSRPYFAANDSVIPQWDDAVRQARLNHDSLGGIVRVRASHVPAGLGEPVFDKLDALLAHAIMSVGAVKGLEFGAGFLAANMTGSEHNDEILHSHINQDASFTPQFGSNNAGGILGGISSSQEIVINVAVKPIASTGKEQRTIDKEGREATIVVGGRHDISAIPRIIPVLSAMTSLAIADAFLMQLHQLYFK